jgi:hypothetical protein
VITQSVSIPPPRAFPFRYVVQTFLETEALSHPPHLYNIRSPQLWHGDVLYRPLMVSGPSIVGQFKRLILRKRSQTPRASRCSTDNRTARFTDTMPRQILKIGSLLKKPKSDNREVQQFRAKVAADRKQLKALLEQRIQQA